MKQNIGYAGKSKEKIGRMKPTEDKELRERLIRVAKNASDVVEWTPSIIVAEHQREIVIDHMLKLITEYGYHKD